MKTFKIKSMIIAMISISSAIAITLLCLIAALNTNAMLNEKINESMSTYLDAQVNAVEEFVKNSENKLRLYSKNQVVIDLIEDDARDMASHPDREMPMFNDESYNTTAYYTDHYPNFPKAQQYTMEYYGLLDNWEGLYIGNSETRILSYSAPPVIGKVLRQTCSAYGCNESKPRRRLQCRHHSFTRNRSALPFHVFTCYKGW